MKTFIIPASMFQGDMGKLRKQDWAMWNALVDRERDLFYRDEKDCKNTGGNEDGNSP